MGSLTPLLADAFAPKLLPYYQMRAMLLLPVFQMLFTPCISTLFLATSRNLKSLGTPASSSMAQQLQRAQLRYCSSTFPIFKHLGGGKKYKEIKGKLVGKPSRQYKCCCCQQALTPQVCSGCFHSPPLMVSSLFQFFFLFFSISGADYAAFYLHKHNYLCLLTHTECSVSRGITSVLLDPSDLAS